VDNAVEINFLGPNDKNLTPIWILLSMIMELWVFVNCHKRPHVNCASRVTLRDLEPVGTETASRYYNSQPALFKTER